VSIRTERVGEEIRKVISARLIRGLRTPLPGFVTISAVEVSGDMGVAKVYYSVFGTEQEVAEATKVLESEKRALRQEVGQKVRLRLTPELVLILDETPEKAARISALLNNLPKSES
jgi:ribosome-binding factor A